MAKDRLDEQEISRKSARLVKPRARSWKARHVADLADLCRSDGERLAHLGRKDWHTLTS